MKYGARFASSVCLATSAVFCLSVLFYATTRFITPVHAERAFITPTVSSSPSSGPVGATISVSGSGWPEPDGEQVSLGYMIGSYCSIVSDAQASPFKSGSFSGSLRLPKGTPPGTYSICAQFGSTTAGANTYTVLTESAPQISISLSTQAGEQQATISGSNYFPAGTTVHLFWEALNGAVIFTITPAVSKSSGLISSTFTVPATLGSGSYKIVATVSGQPSLTTSDTFNYNAPSPILTPLPSPTHQPSPTAVATTITSTPTTGATTPIGSQNTNTGQTPSSGTTNNDSNTNQSTSIVLIGSLAGLLAIFAIVLIIVLFIRRKKARSKQIAVAVGPMENGSIPWQNVQFGGMPNPIHNGSMPASPTWQTTSTAPPQQLQISPYAHLLQQPGGGNSGNTNETSKLDAGDPNLESIKQQVQMGLFATPANRKDS